MSSTIPFSIRIDPEIKCLLDDEAKKADRSASYIAIEAMKKYIESKQQERRGIQAAIEKTDKGEFVSSKAMRIWFASLGTGNELPKPEPDVFIINCNNPKHHSCIYLLIEKILFITFKYL